MKSEMLMNTQGYNLYALTVDIDWAPDFMIDEMASAFIVRNIRCTWFVTHSSPAVDRLRSNPLFELGIHPNFFPGSSHGSTEDEVIKYCLDLVPNAKSVRTHALYQNSRLIAKLSNEYGLLVDCSLFLAATPGLIPHVLYTNRQHKKLLRIPFYWEDDVECFNSRPNWDIQSNIFKTNGLKMFNFHPMYVGLNEFDFRNYELIKGNYQGVKSLSQLTKDEVAPYLNDGPGVKSFFIDLLQYLNSANHPTYTASDILNIYNSNNE